MVRIVNYITPQCLYLCPCYYYTQFFIFTGERPRLHRAGKAAAAVWLCASHRVHRPATRAAQHAAVRDAEGRAGGWAARSIGARARRGSVSPAPAAQRLRGQCTGQWLPRGARARTPRHSHADGRVLLKWRVPIRNERRRAKNLQLDRSGRRRG